MLEALDKSVVEKYADLNHAVGLTLLKIRLLFDLRQLHNAAALRAKAPQEIVDTIRSHLASATITSSPTLLRDVQNGNDLQPYMDLLKSQLWTFVWSRCKGQRTLLVCIIESWRAFRGTSCVILPRVYL